jgi:hypothetical protein
MSKTAFLHTRAMIPGSTCLQGLGTTSSSIRCRLLVFCQAPFYACQYILRTPLCMSVPSCVDANIRQFWYSKHDISFAWSSAYLKSSAASVTMNSRSEKHFVLNSSSKDLSLCVVHIYLPTQVFFTCSYATRQLPFTFASRAFLNSAHFKNSENQHLANFLAE